jgi:excisionase family DNA binding protein
VTPETLLRKPEAAAMLGVSVPTLERLVANRKVPAMKPSPRCVRFRPTDLQRYLSSTATKKY